MPKRKRTPKKLGYETTEKLNKLNDRNADLFYNVLASTMKTTPEKKMPGRKKAELKRTPEKSIDDQISKQPNTPTRRLATRSMTTPPKKKSSPASSPRKPYTSYKRRQTPQKRLSLTGASTSGTGNEGTSKESREILAIKLLGRSLDISTFTSDTPLYALCRAWINDDPKSNGRKPVSKRSDFKYSDLFNEDDPSSRDAFLCNSDDDDDDDDDNDSDGIMLPSPDPISNGRITLRIPSPIPFPRQEINLDYDENPPPSKEELLNFHLVRWREVRNKWRLAAYKNELRYARSKELLKKMFVRFDTPT